MYQECQIQFLRCQGRLWSGETITFPGQDDQRAGYTLHSFHPAKTSNKAFRCAFSWQTIIQNDIWPRRVVIWGTSWKGRASIFTVYSKDGEQLPLYSKKLFKCCCEIKLVEVLTIESLTAQLQHAITLHPPPRGISAFPPGCSHLKKLSVIDGMVSPGLK